MIDCPICHVKNDNDARFCAECGQRLAGQPQQQAEAEQQASQRPQAPPQVPQVQQQQPQQQPPQQSGPRLHSPLLAAGGNDAGPEPGPEPQHNAAEVNRLRQMASKQVDKPAPTPMDTPYKNPYDPRNNLPPEQTQQQPPQGQAPLRRKGGLRSPLLSSEEFDDEEEPYEQQQSAPTQGRGLRSPLLGGGEGGGGGGGGLRSPLLGGGGGGSDYEEDYDQQTQSSGGLRSPLLGGGGGGYGGSDRRRPPDQIDPYGGAERRSGLRSPILGGGGGGDWQEDYYDDEEEDPYADENNPNVLRSPLLSAKRPVSDRPQVKAPANSSMHDPRAAALPPEPSPQVHYPQGSPSSSYNSLRTISSISPKPAQPQPVTPPLPVQQAGFGQSQSQSGPQGFNQMTQSGPQSFGQAAAQMNQQQQSVSQQGFGQPSPAQGAPENPMLNSGPNQLGQVNYQSGVRPGNYQQTPPGFHGTPTDINAYRPGLSVNNQGSANAGDSANPQTASGPFLSPEALTKSPTPLTPSAEPAAPKSTLAGRSAESAPEKPKSKMFGSVDDDYGDDRDSYDREPAFNRFAPAAPAAANPAIKMVGIFAIVLLLGKLFAIISYMQTDWFKFQPFVIDQLVGLLALICLAAICLLPRN